jgi:hypothetical protein
MEPDKKPLQNQVPRQSQPNVPGRSMPPMGRRPMVDGFSARRPQSGIPISTPMQRPQPAVRIPVMGEISSPSPASTPATVQAPQPVPRPSMAARSLNPDFTASRPPVTHAPAPGSAASTPTPPPTGHGDMFDTPPTSKARGPKEHNRTGHAGLVGFGAFILLCALMLLPLLPGKITNFPLASSGFSTGDQSLDCIGTQGPLTSITRYNTKAGTPVTYTYSTTTTQTAACNGQTQSATEGHTSQFNPLGLLVDIALALVIAAVIARVWRMVFGEKKHKSRHHED